MAKEEEIFNNMRKRGRIYKKKNGQFAIASYNLWNSITEAGYDTAQTSKIIDNMMAKGYIRREDYGFNPGLRYTILKWVN